MPVVAPIGDGPPDGPDVPDGPQLVLVISNVSRRDIEVSYEYEALQLGGGGGGSVGSCELAQMSFESIQGHYTVLIDGNAVHEADVPPFAAAGTSILVRVNIDSEDGIQVGPPQLLVEVPQNNVRGIPGCG